MLIHRTVCRIASGILLRYSIEQLSSPRPRGARGETACTTPSAGHYTARSAGVSAMQASISLSTTSRPKHNLWKYPRSMGLNHALYGDSPEPSTRMSEPLTNKMINVANRAMRYYLLTADLIRYSVGRSHRPRRLLATSRGQHGLRVRPRSPRCRTVRLPTSLPRVADGRESRESVYSGGDQSAS